MKKINQSLPLLMNTAVKAGFPSLVEDSGGLALDLNNLLVKHPVSTYYLRVDGDSMRGAGIANGDIVVVDKSLEARAGDIIVATVDGQFTLKRLRVDGRKVWLMAENPDYPPIALHEAQDASVWGVVTFWIHQQR